jgi:hypothetical protein
MRTRGRWTVAVGFAGALFAAGSVPPGGPALLPAAHAAPAGDAVVVEISSEPTGASVQLDGKDVGTTPLRDLRVAPGRHVLRLVAPEHDAYEKEIDLVADGSLYVPAVRLVPWPVLTTDTLAPDVTLTVDGAAPRASGRVEPGRRVVVFARPGFAQQRIEVDAVAGKDLTVRAAPWEGFQALVDLSALPKDVAVEHAGTKTTGPQTLRLAAAGLVPLRFTRSGYFPQDVIVDARLGATVLPALREWIAIPAVLAARRKGLGKKLDPAVTAGLIWLAQHQRPDGAWDCVAFSERCTEPGACGGPGEPYHTVGVTGLATLAFLGAGSTHVEGPYRENVARAVKWLVARQDKEGCVGARTNLQWAYDHAAASMALFEDYWLTQDPALRASAQAAVGFLQATQNPYLAWRYGVRDGDNDTSVTVWNALALRTAAWAGLDVDQGVFTGPLAWIDKMTEPEFGKTGYQQRGGGVARIPDGNHRNAARAGLDADLQRLPGNPTMGPLPGRPMEMGGFTVTVPTDVAQKFPHSESEALTAGAAVVRHLCRAANEKDDFVAMAAELVAKKSSMDVDAGSFDLHHAHFGSLLHAQLGGKTLQAWRERVESKLVEKQRTSNAAPCAIGTWNPEDDPFGVAGGRVYATAMALLALEAPNRFPRVTAPKKR